MSTKTTFKRVALVAVAALGLGVLASAPSNAAPVIAYGVIADATAGQAVVGGQATVTITLDTATVTNVVVSGVGSVLATTQISESVTVVGTVTSGSFSDSVTVNGAIKPVQTITIGSAVAGVTTITATPLSATGVPGTAVTKTVTWVTSTTQGTYDHSYARISSDTTTAGATLYNNQAGVDSTTAQLTFSSTITGAKVASVVVREFNASDTSTTTTLDVAGTKSVVVAISGAGIIGATAATAGTSATVAAATATDAAFYVFADGRNGKATITVTVNGVLVDTKYVNFYGVVSAYAASTTTGETLSKNYIGVGSAESATVTIKGLDSNKVVMAPNTFYVTTDTATIATASITAGGVVNIVGVAAGKTNVNVCDTSACTSAKIKYTFPIEVTSATVGSVSLAFDKGSYAPGEKMTVTVSALTEKGRPVADGSRNVLKAAATANILPNGSLPDTTVAFVDGVATYTLYAPASSGTLTITATEAAAVAPTAQATATASGATYTAAVRTASATIVNSGADAATDAANEATDAANAATDAALAAADAADAATAAAQDASDAVAALSATVAKLVASLKAQITSLTNLVIKIQKKVKA